MKRTEYFESSYEVAQHYPNGVPSTVIAIVGEGTNVFVSSDNSEGDKTQQYFSADLTNDDIVEQQVETAYTAGVAAGEAYYIETMTLNGTSYITTTSQYDVTTYAYAQVSDANLIPANIVSGTSILGVTGSYEGGITPTGTAYINANTATDVTSYAYAYCIVSSEELGNNFFGIHITDNEATCEISVNLEANTINYFYYSYDKQHWTSADFSESMDLSFYIGAGYDGDTMYFSISAERCPRFGLNAYKDDNTSSVEFIGNYASLVNGFGYKYLEMPEYAFKSAFSEINDAYIDASGSTLPSTVSGHMCENMFSYSSKLTAAPQLPATTLAENCYSNMLDGCPLLTEAPELPATTLADWCYCGMFINSGIESIVLPATTLASYCYLAMFKGAFALESITCLGLNDAYQAFNEWMDTSDAGTEVYANGTLYKDSNTTINFSQKVPSGWTVENYTPAA